MRRSSIQFVNLVLATCLALPATSAAAGSANQVNNARDTLPTRSEGHRFTSTPYGETAAILSVADAVRNRGIKHTISSRGLHIPNKSGNRIIQRYDLTFPTACGGQTFSYYEGQNFSALGYHSNGKVVFDLISGGSPYSAPRLWGPYDQVINDPVPMQMVISNDNNNSFGVGRASFVVGKVANMPQPKGNKYGNIYSRNVDAASRCASGNQTDNILVQK